jgi:hypothetical protein
MAPMRDVLLTLASAAPHPQLLHLRLGARETFIDVRGQIAVQFGRIDTHLVAKVVAAGRAGRTVTVITGPGAVSLLETLRQAATKG